MTTVESMLGRIDERTVLIHADLKEFKTEQKTVNEKQQGDIDSLKLWRAWLAGGIAFLTLAGTVAFKWL